MWDDGYFLWKHRGQKNDNSKQGTKGSGNKVGGGSCHPYWLLSVEKILFRT